MEFLAGTEKQFFDFISEIDEKDKVAIVSHIDDDGICSVVPAEKVLGNVEIIKFVHVGGEYIKPFVPEFKEKKINKVLFFDLAIENSMDGMKKLLEFAEVLVLDHHRFDEDLNYDKLIYLKTESSKCSSYASYYLFSKIQNLEDIDWIALIGTVGDWCYYENKEFCDKIIKKYGLDIKDNFKEMKIWKIADMISRAMIYWRYHNNEDIFGFYEKLKNASLKELSEFEEMTKPVVEEIKKWNEKFYDERKEFKKGYFWEFRPKYSVKNNIVSALSEKEPDKFFVFITERDENDFFTISSRCQSKKGNCVELLKCALEGVEGSSGGHVVAAGGVCNKKDKEKFKENLFKILDE
ncbi:MAG: hypothetical protein KKF56_02605 [Nanoarchaeota archaeon]|nr:hypothetical protein [Nanoarchaeota archaeon]